LFGHLSAQNCYPLLVREKIASQSMYICCVCRTSNVTSSRRCEHCPHIICEYCRCYGSWLDMSEDADDDSEPLDAEPGNEHQICTASEDSLSSGELLSTPKILERTTLHQEVRERTRQALQQKRTTWPWSTRLSSLSSPHNLGVSHPGQVRRRSMGEPERSSWESEIELAYQWGAESTCHFDWSAPADGEGQTDLGTRTTIAKA